MNIHLFLLCYNESVLLPHTIKHYKTYLPNCVITIYDNESTDDSVQIARDLGCNVISWNSQNCIDDFKYKEIKNNCWKSVDSAWIIMADMDEFLCITQEELQLEMNAGVTILNTIGHDMIGESTTIDLSDIQLCDIKKYVVNHYESKKLCFLRPDIQEINYECGAHTCNPIGNVAYSSTVYINKHMSSLGLPFLTNKLTERYKRAEKMRSHGMAFHYKSDKSEIETMYASLLSSCKMMD